MATPCLCENVLPDCLKNEGDHVPGMMVLIRVRPSSTNVADPDPSTPYHATFPPPLPTPPLYPCSSPTPSACRGKVARAPTDSAVVPSHNAYAHLRTCTHALLTAQPAGTECTGILPGRSHKEGQAGQPANEPMSLARERSKEARCTCCHVCNRTRRPVCLCWTHNHPTWQKFLAIHPLPRASHRRHAPWVSATIHKGETFNTHFAVLRQDRAPWSLLPCHRPSWVHVYTCNCRAATASRAQSAALIRRAAACTCKGRMVW